MTGTDKLTMELTAGDTLEIQFTATKGSMQMEIKEPDGDTLYAGNGNDAHAVASVRIKREFADTDQGSLPCVQTQALTLLHAHTKEMKEKYGG